MLWTALHNASIISQQEYVSTLFLYLAYSFVFISGVKNIMATWFLLIQFMLHEVRIHSQFTVMFAKQQRIQWQPLTNYRNFTQALNLRDSAWSDDDRQRQFNIRFRIAPCCPLLVCFENNHWERHKNVLLMCALVWFSSYFLWSCLRVCLRRNTVSSSVLGNLIKKHV